MRARNRQFGIVMGLMVLAACFACHRDAGPEGSQGGKGKLGKGMREQYLAGKARQKADEDERPKPAPEPPPAAKMPEVKMPAALAQTCLVKVGDAMPEAALANLEGKPAALRSLLGKKLTAVLFWQSDNMYATQALEYLELDVVKQFGAKGVQAVGINVKDAPDAARKAVEESAAKYVNLLDPAGAYYAKVATEKIPRVYLLDAAGKVLWFDIEYSTSTRRDLERAIRFKLGEK
jgi:peroxiredoxin